MSASQIEQVRRFNRMVTERVGALDDRFLARGRPLGQARVLWEIGPGGADLRDLRSRLRLDSGYLSRLLTSLEADGLIEVVPSESDRRVRTARLTRRGRTERRTLDRRSDASAESILEPLTPAQRERLGWAMTDVEGLLRASSVEIAIERPSAPRAQTCLRAYFAELATRFETGYDPAAGLPAGDDELAAPHGVFLVATAQGEPVGCAGVHLRGRGPADVKRMWVSSTMRGLGLGRRLLTEIETTARAAGARSLRLETNHTLSEAIGLYRSAGFVEVPAFNDEVYAQHWLEKRLVTSRRVRSTS